MYATVARQCPPVARRVLPGGGPGTRVPGGGAGKDKPERHGV